MQKEVIRVIRPDGEILEYKAPRKVRHVLSEFGGHAISDTLPVIRHLHPEANMVVGREYYLLPLPAGVPTGTGKRAVAFSKPDVAAAEGQGTEKVVRIKLIISKHELQAMLQKGAVTVGDMIPEFQKEEIENGVDSLSVDDDNKISCRRWKPKLESIPEVN